MHALLLLVSLMAVPLPPQAAPAPTDREVAELFALASARLLGSPGGQQFTVLPTHAGMRLGTRARRASGDAFAGSPALARAVVARLREKGYHGARLTGSPDLRLVLGEVRFEPPTRPSFARLTLGVVGSGDAAEVVEFLLKREPGGWVVLKMELEDSVG